MKVTFGFVLASFLLTGPCFSAEREPITEKEKTNYSVGYQIGGDFRRQGVELDTDLLVQGIRDSLGEGTPKMSPKEMQRTLSILKSRIAAADVQRKSAQYESDLKEGRAFLEKNAKEEGIVSLPGGLQYKIVREGTGATPGPLDNVSVHYVGLLTGGSEFFSTLKGGKPSTVLAGNLIPGMRDIVLRMKAGARWQAFVPPEMGYPAGTPLYGKAVIFDIDLLKVGPGSGTD